MKINHKLKNSLFYMLMTLLYSLALSYNVQVLMGIKEVQVFDHVLTILFFLLVIKLLFSFPKVTLSIIGGALLLGVVHWFFDLEWVTLETFEFVVSPTRWMITLNSLKGPMPENMYLILSFYLALVSYLLVYQWSNPLSSVLVLTQPLLYVNTTNLDNIWMAYYILGLMSSAPLFGRDRHQQKTPSPLMMGLVLLIVMSGTLITTSEQFYSPRVSTFINDFSLFPDRPSESDFSLSQVGFNDGNTRIGGPVELIDEAYMRVVGPAQSFYLRGTIYENFNDNVWTRTSMNDSIVFDGEKSDVWKSTFYHDERLSFPSAVSSTQMFNSRNLFIQPVNRSFTTVFTAGSPEKIVAGPSIQGEVTDQFRYNLAGQVTSSEPITSDGYSLQDIVTPTQNRGLGIATTSGLNPRQNAPLYLYEEMVFEHDPNLHQLVYEQLVQSENKLLIIQSIINYFDQNYAYSINVEHVPFEDSVIEWFFINKEGYCVYFGSAMTLLLQDVGIDARYVEGFVVPARKETQEVDSNGNVLRTVTTNTAHAWTEIFLEGYGWYPIDATSSSHLQQLNDGSVVEPPIEEVPLEPVEPTDPVIPEPVEPNEPVTPEQSLWTDLLNWLTKNIALILIVLAVVLVGVWRVGLVRKRGSKTYLLKQFEDRERELVLYVWKDLLKLSDHLVSPADSVKESLVKLYETLEMEENHRVIEFIEKVLYNNGLPSRQETIAFMSFYDLLAKKVYVRENIGFRLIHQWFVECRWVNR